MTQPTLVVWLPEKFGLTVPGSLYGTAHFVFQVACSYGFGLPEKTAWSFGLSGIWRQLCLLRWSFAFR
jgi:hypothetical protein